MGVDFNWRLLSSFRRSTEDVGGGSDASYRTSLAREWHQQAGLRPLYGQQGQPRGVYTSCTDNGRAEVDGVSVCERVPSGWIARALAVPEWESYSSRGGVHRPVGAAVLSPLVEAVPDERRATGAQQHGGRGSAPGPKRVFPLPYGSPQYHAMSGAVADCVTGAARQLAAGTVDAAGALAAVAKGLVEIQTEYYVDGQQQQQQQGRGRGNRAQPVTTLRHHLPPAPFRRLTSGIRAPPAVVAQLSARRKHSAELKRAKLELRRAGGRLGGDATQIQQRITKATAGMAAIDRDVRRQLAQLDAKEIEEQAEELAHLAGANPARFFRMLRNRLPGEAGVYDESSGPSPEKCADFRDFFAALLAKLRGQEGRLRGDGGVRC